jgi:hypothetical protein
MPFLVRVRLERRHLEVDVAVRLRDNLALESELIRVVLRFWRLEVPMDRDFSDQVWGVGVA